MKIENGKVVNFHYRLSVEGKQLESSYDQEPMAYLHGKNNIVPGLEIAMNNKAEGDTFTAQVAPEQGYGLRRDNAEQRIPIKHLVNNKKTKLQKGMVVHINTNQGVKQATVIKAGRFNVDVDTNHPLAGKTLDFEIEIVAIRDATDEEMAHGHAHGPGGHQH